MHVAVDFYCRLITAVDISYLCVTRIFPIVVHCCWLGTRWIELNLGKLSALHCVMKSSLALWDCEVGNELLMENGYQPNQNGFKEVGQKGEEGKFRSWRKPRPESQVVLKSKTCIFILRCWSQGAVNRPEQWTFRHNSPMQMMAIDQK